MNSHAHPTFPSEADRLHAAGAVYHHDYAGEIDTEEEILADMLGVTPKQARGVMEHTEAEVRRSQSLILGKVVGMLLETSNLPVMAHALAFAAGLDQLNGKRSQAEVARELGVTRALVSHYVIGVRDVLSGKRETFDCTKFRKSNDARKIFKEKATDPYLAAKAKRTAEIKATGPRMAHGFAEIQRQTGEDPYGRN
jgi:hypothetical protein